MPADGTILNGDTNSQKRVAQPERFAYVTGGASGIGKGVVQMLAKRNIGVFIADYNLQVAQEVVDELRLEGHTIECGAVDVVEWPSQVEAFTRAIESFGRIDLVYPIAGVGEQRWLPKGAGSCENGDRGFEKPNMRVLDVDLTGVLYTVALAVQQFRRQGLGADGVKGKIVTVSSVCGIYSIPTMPTYTSAKHGVTGFVQSYGTYLGKEEQITLNAVCPHVVRTPISAHKPDFYSKVESLGLFTPLENVMEVFARLLEDDQTSGGAFEVGPNYHKNGAVSRSPVEPLDAETAKLAEVLYLMGSRLQEP